jgi:type IV pilus assembly protein PilO
MKLDDLKKLDPKEIGAWPWPLRAVVLAVVFALVVTAGYMFMIKDKLEQRDRIAAEEQTLRNTFDTRQRRAAALDQYRAQLDEMQRTFGAMLRQLPAQAEVDNLLVDISQSALAPGLEHVELQPQAGVRPDLNAEQPKRKRLSGGYRTPSLGRAMSRPGHLQIPSVLSANLPKSSGSSMTGWEQSAPH